MAAPADDNTINAINLLIDSPSSWEHQLLMLVVVAGAAVLGGAIGFERELANRPAGFRTHMLVAAMSALLICIVPDIVTYMEPSHDGEAQWKSDPIRIIQAIVTGVSFLGAGTIFTQRRKNHVVGLTTAASLLMATGVGITVGLRLWILAIGITLLTLLALRGVHMLEARLTQMHTDQREDDEDGESRGRKNSELDD